MARSDCGFQPVDSGLESAILSEHFV